MPQQDLINIGEKFLWLPPGAKQRWTVIVTDVNRDSELIRIRRENEIGKGIWMLESAFRASSTKASEAT